MRTTGLILLSLVIVACLVAVGCDSSGTGPGNGGSPEYRLVGAYVQDLNSGRAVAVAEVFRRDTLRPAASVTLDTAQLTLGNATTVTDTMIALAAGGDTTRYVSTIGPADDSAFAAWLSSASRYAGDGLLVAVEEGSFDDQAVVTAVDTFSILPDGIVPQNRLVRANDVVTVDWSGSGEAETYVMAAVRADLAYQGAGYSLYATQLTTGGTIPQDAFLTPGTSDLDTGLYRIYVYSVSGAPDSALSAELLPVPLPSQLADNIDQREMRGRYGTVMVCMLDTVRVSER